MTGEYPGWIESNGGPLLLLRRSLLESWEGVEGPVSSSTDYDRACATPDLTTIPVGDGVALVLGDEPLPTRVYDHPSGVLLVRWRYAPTDAAVDAVVARPLTDLAWSALGVLEVDEEPLLLFDSAFPGADPGGSSGWLWLSRGAYGIEVAEYAPTSELALQLIRLRLCAT